MTASFAIDLAAVLRAAGGLLAGGLLGLAHFASLRANARLFAGGGAARAFGLQALRFALLAAGLGGLARFGAAALLAGALGLLLARGAVLRRVAREEAAGDRAARA